MRKLATSIAVAIAAIGTSGVGAQSTTIDFSGSTCYGMSESKVMVQNIRVLVPITNPFDPSSTTVISYAYNVPFDFNSSTLHLVPNLTGAAQTDDGSGSSSTNCATVQVRVADAYTGNAISGATVSIGSQTATTNTSGVATLSSVTAGVGQVSASASNYSSASQATSLLTCSATNDVSVALSPTTGSGALSASEFRVVLTWGENPYDLDSHLTGPYSATDTTSRFHVYYSSTTADVASLDVDDTSSYGPETITVSPPSGSSTLRPGVYRYSVHHYSGSETIGTSGANVRLILGNGTTYNYTPSSSMTFSGRKDVWTVFELTVGSTGTVYVAPVDSVYNESSAYSVRSSGGSLPSHSGYGKPEDMSLFRYTK